MTDNTMSKRPPSANPKCPLCSSISVKNGLRSNKYRTTQRFLCKSCNRAFMIQQPLQKHKTYNIIAIISAISKHNLGAPLRQHPFPKSTVHNWITHPQTKTPMQRHRHRLKDLPKYKVIKQKRFIHHNQPFLYQYHTLKLSFAKQFPGLRTYLTKLYLPKQAFKEQTSKRVSIISKKPRYTPKIQLNQKENYATQLAALATQITKNNRHRHQIVENLMITNDTSTIATEIPIYTSINTLSNKIQSKNKPNISTNNTTITGHIDILQVRYNKLYLLDYKPEPINTKQTITQLLLYRRLLSKRTKIKKDKIKLAFFNEKGYYEIH